MYDLILEGARVASGATAEVPSVLHQWRRPLSISVVVAALLYIGAVIASDGSEVLSRLGQLPVWLVVILFVLPTCGFLIRFIRWEFLLRSLGHEVPRIRHARIYLAGFALTTTPGKVGENLRAMFLLPYGVPIADSFGAFVTERLGDLIVMVTLSALMFGLVGSYVWAVAVSAILTLAGVALLRDPRFSSWLLARDDRGRLGRALAGGGRALQACRSLLGLRLLVLGVGLAFIAWSAEGLTFALAARYLGIEVSITVAVGIFALGTLLGALSFLPGGVGPTEAVMGGLLVLAGASVAEATAATLLVRATTLWWAVLLGAGALIGLGTPPPAAGRPLAGGEPPESGESPASGSSPLAG